MRVLVPLAPGFEEIEAVTIIDVLRRAGCEVTAASLKTNPVKGSHGIEVTADAALAEVRAGDFDAIALPGGMPGSEHLKQDERVLHIVRELSSSGRLVAAICAAPIALGAAGVLAGRRATCYPGFEHEMKGAIPVNEPVVRDGNIVTGRGPACAIPFALALVAALAGDEKARDLAQTMQAYWM